MIVNEKSLVFNDLDTKTYFYTLNNKTAGSMVNSILKVTKSNGTELTQAEYDSLHVHYDPANGRMVFDNFYDGLNYIVELDLKLLGNDLQKTIDSITKIQSGLGYAWSYDSSSYQEIFGEEFITKDYIDFANLISPDGIMKFKTSEYETNIYLGITFARTVDKVNTVKLNLPETFDMLFHNVANIHGDSKVFPRVNPADYLFRICDKSDLFDFDFADGLIPDLLTENTCNAMVVEDPYNPGTQVLAFDNLGSDYSTGEISINTTSDKPMELSFDFFIESEQEYDWFSVLVDEVEKLTVSGNQQLSVAVNEYNFALSPQCYNKCTMVIPAGSHTVKFLYIKDSSGSDGFDDVLISRISAAEINSDFGIKFNKSNVQVIDKGNVLAQISNPVISNKKCVNVLYQQNSSGFTIKANTVGQNNLATQTVAGSKIAPGLYDCNFLKSTTENNNSITIVDDIYIKKGNNYSSAEATDIIKGIHADFPLPKIKSGVIIPNNTYALIGTADLFNEFGKKTRTVTADFTTASNENKIVVSEGSVCKLKC